MHRTFIFLLLATAYTEQKPTRRATVVYILQISVIPRFHIPDRQKTQKQQLPKHTNTH